MRTPALPPLVQRRYGLFVLLTVSTGGFMSTLDIGMVSVSLPSLGRALGESLGVVQWVVLINLLMTGALLLPLGALGDQFGHKRIYAVGIGLYFVGSVMALASDNIQTLLLARAVQATGAAGVQANGRAMTVTVFPLSERGRVLGFYTTLALMGAILGQVIGGIIVDTLGWRFVFLPGAIVGPVGLLAALWILDERRVSPERGRSGMPDWAGMALSAVAIVTGLLALTRGVDVGWTASQVLLLGAIAVAALAAFLAIALRVPRPMVDLRLLLRPVFSAHLMAGTLAFIAHPVNTYLTPFYLQGVLGYSARAAGLIFLPMPVMLALVGPLGGWLSDRMGFRAPSVLGLGCIGGAMLLFTRLSDHAGMVGPMLAIGLIGVGLGLFQPANSSAIIGSVGRSQYGLVSALTNLAQTAGRVTGIAIATMQVTLAMAAQGVAPDIGGLKGGTVAADPRAVTGFLNGFHNAMYFGLGLCIFALVMALVDVKKRAEKHESLSNQNKSPPLAS